LAVVLLALLSPQGAQAQATFLDIGASTAPPHPGPNDIYETNVLNEFYGNAGINYFTDNTGQPGGSTFQTAGNPLGYVVTNIYVQTTAGGAGNNGSPSQSYTTAQSYQVSFYQINGDPSGFGSNAAFISQVITPGTSVVKASGDWLCFSNIVVFLQPGVTNAFTWGRLSTGWGYIALPMITNGGGGPPPPFPNGHVCIISPAGGANTVNYAVATQVNYNDGSTINVWKTNTSTIFSMGIIPGFVAPIFTTNPPSYELTTTGGTFTLPASASGSTNAQYSMFGYWQKSTQPGVWTTLSDGGHISGSTPHAITPQGAGGGNGGTVSSVLTISSISTADVGSYHLVMTNSQNGTTINSATSQVATISFYTPASTSFATAAINTPGIVAFWPLNELVDPSTGQAIAFDVVGGFNGLYGLNANDGGGNAVDAFAPTVGPIPPALTGFPSGNTALGSVNGTLANTYVSTVASPTFLTGTTNVTILAWIKPMITEPASTGIVFMRSGTAGATNTDGLNYGGTGQELGYNWDNGGSATTGYNSGLIIPSNTWSMVAVVITSSNSVFYVGNTNNGLTSATQTIVNSNQVWGKGLVIGGDPGGSATGRSFGGLISSVAMFNTSLTAAQIETLFDTGIAQNSQMPFITANPLSTKLVTGTTGVTATFTASGYGGTSGSGNPSGNSSGYWQKSTSPGVWTTLASDTVHVNAGVPIATNLTTPIVSTLMLTNVASGDVASYQLVITNSPNGTTINSVTSSVATFSFVTAPAANTFAAAALNPALAPVAFWPLNETVDPSTGFAEAFDIVGGFNGLYGLNADNGGGNAVDSFAAVPGPAAAGLTGFAAGGALGSVQNVLQNTFVTTLASPTFPVSNTNVTIIAWVYPNTLSEAASTGLVFMRSGTGSATNTDGIGYGSGSGNSLTGNNLGYTWDNNSSATYNFTSYLTIPSNMWSMVAVVISPANSTFYVANTNNGLVSATQTIANSNQPWGGTLVIGGDPGGSAVGRSFGGYISSVAMFATNLTPAQLDTLFDSGLASDNQLPSITANPLSTQLTPSLPVNVVTFNAGGYGGVAASAGYWQFKSGAGSYAPVSGPEFVSGATAAPNANLDIIGSLVISNFTSADYGSYQFVITNSLNGTTINTATSAAATLSVLAAPAAGSFAAAVVNPAYGAVAFWPLNETADPSTGTAEAYDIVGGFNGLYGINANNGGGNHVDGFSAVPGPKAAGLSGFAAGGALGSLQNSLANTFVTTLASPTLSPAAGGATNMTIVAWINPLTNNDAANAGLVMQRTATQVDGLKYGNSANTIGYNWDNNATTYNYTGTAIPTNLWSMVAVVVTANNATLYVGNTNGLFSVVQTGITNTNQIWGGPLTIGGDPATSIVGRSFGGSISSVAMFSNALSVAQIENLFDAGEAQGNVLPVITSNPNYPAYQLMPGGSAAITAAGYASPAAAGGWQKSTTPGVWVPLANVGDVYSGATTSPVGPLQVSTLVLTNISSVDQGSYELVVTNSFNGTTINSATSSVFTLTVVAPVAGSFAAAVTNPALAPLAFWPLNEARDPSTGTAEAYDVLGGFNGYYGTNAQDGAQNSYIAANTPQYLLSAFGPAPSLTGFSGDSSGLASVQGSLQQTFVTTGGTPMVATNNTNMTIVGWIYPLAASEGAGCGLFFSRSGYAGSTMSDGMQYGGASTLGYHWDNDQAATYNYAAGPTIPISNWCMVAVVITPQSNMLYLGVSNIMYTSTEFMTNSTGTTNINQTWGGAVVIGGDPGNSATGRSFYGYMSSFAMFGTNLNLTNLEALYSTGVSSGGNLLPVITAQPVVSSVKLIAGGNLTITATGYGTAPCLGTWQYNNGSGYAPLVNDGVHYFGVTTVPAGVSGIYQAGTLVISNYTAALAGSYELLVTNAAGSVASKVVVVSTAAGVPAGGFASVATSPGYGAVAYWPLDDVGDPSTGTVVAYDVFGGYNGVYLTNAQDYTPNSLVAGLGSPAGQYVLPPVGPGSVFAGFSGLTASLGDWQNIPAMSNSYVIVSNAPIFANNGNGTNISMMAWIYPNNNLEGSQTGIIANNRPGGVAASMSYGNFSYGPSQGSGWQWNNWAYTYNTNSGLVIPTNSWSLVAMCVSPSNVVFYVGNTNEGLITSTIWLTNASGVGTNVNQPWGTNVYIGADPYTIPARNFGGYISSVAMFTNTLSIPQMQALYNAGVVGAANNYPPTITTQPSFPTYHLLAGGSATITATGYGGLNGSGFWQKWNGSSWVTLTNGGDTFNVAAVPVGTVLVGALTLTNVTAADATSYQLVITNGGTGLSASSTPAVVTIVPPPPANSYEAAALTPGFGLTAFWPLSENGNINPAYPQVEAYEIWGGWNGYYGTNAGDGGYNNYPATPFPSPVTGPEPTPLAGFPNNKILTGFPSVNYSLGCATNVNATTVKTLGSPTLPPNTTNITITAWIEPEFVAVQNNNAGILMMDSGGQLDGLMFSTSDYLGYTVDGIRGAPTSGLTPPSNQWSFVALTIANTNYTLYLGTTNGLVSAAFTGTNAYQAWGQALDIGGDPASDPGDTFNGYLSSVALFSNALSSTQIGILFAAGLSSGNLPPIISTEPYNEELYSGRQAQFNVTASGIGTLTYQWQKWNGTAWVNVPTNSGGYTGGTTASLTISSGTAGAAASYQVVVTDLSGSTTNPTPVTLSYNSSPLNAYSSAVTALNPVAYWRLFDADGKGYAYDYWGGLTGIYNVGVTANDVEGTDQHFFPGGGFDPKAALDMAPEFTNALAQAANLDPQQIAECQTTSYISVPPLNINSNVMTVTMWINPNETQTHVNGLLYTRAGGAPAGFGFGNTGAAGLGYNWNNNAATYNYSSGLVPSNGVWSFAAWVITPTNAITYLYGTNSQPSVINAVTNPVVAWNGVATIGTDLYDATGARQFDGAIDEVAVYNQALTQNQINNLFTVATGIQVPATIQQPPTISGVNPYFVNLGGLTNLTLTTVAANGTLFYQWLITNTTTLTSQVITNGNNGFAGSLFSFVTNANGTLPSIATNGTLAISNVPVALSGATLMVVVTNSVTNTPATATVTLPNIFPTPAVWTANFCFTNAGNWQYNATPLDPPTGYTGNYGVLGNGTYWNALVAPGNATVGEGGLGDSFTIYAYTNNTFLDSTSNVLTGLTGGMHVSVSGQPYADGTVPYSNELLEHFIQGFPATVTGTNTTPGYYNFVLYPSSGTFNLAGTTTFSIHNASVVNTYGPYTPNFVFGQNYVILTNVLITNSFTLAMAYSGNGFDFSGFQVQFISPQAPLTIARTATNTVVLTWAGENLLNSTTVNGTFTNVPNATSPYVVPILSGQHNFYMLGTNGPSPGIPIN
jgi:hypothetical protein